jgi:hypothetical protein
MKKIFLFVVLSCFAFGQAPNLFSTYLITGVTSTDTTFYFTITDSAFAGSGTSYYATIWDTYYINASEAYKANKAEIVLVNSRTANHFDVERGQLGTTARSFNTSGRRYKISADFISSVYNLPAFSAGDNGKVVTTSGTATSWTAKYTDSISAHRTLINSHTNSIAAHADSINALRSDLVAQTTTALLDSIARHTDTLLTHNTRINSVKQMSLDSILVHRTQLNKTIDSTATHRTQLNKTMDSTTSHRNALDSLIRNKGAVLNSKYEPAPGTTLYLMLGGITANANVNYVQIPFSRGIFKNLRVWMGGSNTIQITVTVQKNGINTNLALTATPQANGAATYDLVNSFSTDDGDLINFKLVTNSSGFGPAFAYYTVEFIQQ